MRVFVGSDGSDGYIDQFSIDKALTATTATNNNYYIWTASEHGDVLQIVRANSGGASKNRLSPLKQRREMRKEKENG